MGTKIILGNIRHIHVYTKFILEFEKRFWDQA